MKYLALIFSLLLSLSALPSFSEVTQREAIEAQLASALASADYASKKCPNIRIDKAKIDSLATRSGKSLDALRKTEDYKEQKDVILEMENRNNGFLICGVLPSAHGGYARGILTAK